MVLMIYFIIFSTMNLARSIPIMEVGPKEDIPAEAEVHFKVMNSVEGTYEFGYDTGAGDAQSYRYENRTADGRVYGKYGFIAPDGVLREVHYIADEDGYRTFLINRYPVKMTISSFIGPIPSRLKFKFTDKL